jgi:predicted Fe-Mo cluster-binding NifX family protein
MRIVVSANGMDLDAQTSPVFGRCPAYVFVDVKTVDEEHPMTFEAVENPALGAAGGAGIRAAQFVVERGAKAVISGNVGPNAFGVLQAASVPVYAFGGGTVRQAVEAYKAGKLSAAGGATARAHAGMGGGAAMAASTSNSTPAREEEIVALKQEAVELRQRLAEVVERLDRLEKGG